LEPRRTKRNHQSLDYLTSTPEIPAVKQIEQAAASNTKAESTTAVNHKPVNQEVSASPARKPEISKPQASTDKMWLYQQRMADGKHQHDAD
jgi:hypothetical protein